MRWIDVLKIVQKMTDEQLVEEVAVGLTMMKSFEMIPVSGIVFDEDNDEDDEDEDDEDEDDKPRIYLAVNADEPPDFAGYDHLAYLDVNCDRLPPDNLVLSPQWPEGLQMNHAYTFYCDDKGSNEATYFSVYVATDGDCHLSAQEWENVQNEGSKPYPLPSIRCRTRIGGGRHGRVRQALLWLARAIQLDNEELGIKNKGET